ncbi:uncharacterized protein LOC132790313 [Drosophila nasuta]|uniref:Uncharacterized protein LOC117567271 n=1 Tax=Drosophila albomicans TaxID=7291 RepID=A0A6P8WH80_DROAB|nr:uncharacterized protein LOC117567271 [Drosophila albomicans]XP_060654787.1 uncharacterized protein LOC132790313 [Drosophila nasuta]
MKFFVIAFAVIAAAAATSISTEYLPPVDNNLEVVAESIDAPVEQGVLSDDGYRYKTVRRLKLRHRRDVSELPLEYLPPVEAASEEVAVETPVAEDGYRYKTVRRVIRRRRDVSELPLEYLPPVEAAATQEVAVEAPVQESAVLADDGYRYKTVRRVIRRRRDVNELSNEYLPPVEVAATQEVVAAAPVEESAVLADDGYRYKTVRRVIRRRRDVNELSNEYLPPVEVAATQEVVAAAPVEESAVLADDGYRYKTVRRVIRRRRDVNELSNEYLPPVEVAATQEVVAAAPVEESAVLADDGYRYKTVRRVIRRRRDVSELPLEYLPPVEAAATEAVAVETPVAEDGYRYKTVRRVIRRRRDVSELPLEYLPPVEAAATEAVAVETPVAEDGYRYKTVRRVIRRRRDVSELANEYLPPVEQTPIIDVPAEPTILADDGYRYKTVRRLKLRRH